MHRYTVAALIVVGGSVQRHMQITDEVDNIAEGLGALARFGMAIPENGPLLGNGLGDAALPAAILLKRTARSPARNIDVMPRTILAFIAHVVRPGGTVRQQIMNRGTAIAFDLRIN